jgi:hypothetical protein
MTHHARELMTYAWHLHTKVRDALLRFSRQAEHNMGMPAYARRWTAAEVRELTDESRHWPRFELIDGELLVTPAPRPVHQIAVSELLRKLAG